MSDTQYELDADRFADECEMCGKLNAYCKCEECSLCHGTRLSFDRLSDCPMCEGEGVVTGKTDAMRDRR